MRRLLRRCIHLGGMYQRRSGRIRSRHISGECWQEPRVRYRFKARSEPDQRGLAEGSPDETMPIGMPSTFAAGTLMIG